MNIVWSEHVIERGDDIGDFKNDSQCIGDATSPCILNSLLKETLA